MDFIIRHLLIVRDEKQNMTFYLFPILDLPAPNRRVKGYL